MDAPKLVPTPIQVSAEEEGISYQEFLKRYDGVHAEWIVGRVEIRVSNNTQHQRILGFLHALIRLFLGFKPLGEVFTAGISMYIDDDRPAREPDLLIVLNQHKERIHPTYIMSPVDIAVEIVSPESTERDYGAKFLEYETAGVPEYWLIDPTRKQTRFYALNDVNGELRYQNIEPDNRGRLVSRILQGFVLDPDILWKDDLPNGQQLIDMVQAMVSEGS